MRSAEINKLGAELELFTSVDYIGKGFPIMLPRGARLIKNLRNYIEYLEERYGYKIVRTPNVSNSTIYKMEDRFDDANKEEMFIIDTDTENLGDDENDFVLRPRVEPFHCAVFGIKKHSYRELPVKLCETSTVYRNEKDLKGLNIVRQFTMSDASVFCEPEKVEQEIYNGLKFQKALIEKMQLDNITYEINTWNEAKKEDYIGTIAEWENVTNAMKRALEDLGVEYTVNNKAKIYGPIIRAKQDGVNFSKIQVDFEIPHRFDLAYTNIDNEEKTPIYIHNTLIGSYENLLGILISKYNGNIPLWIEPHQVVIITDGPNTKKFAEQSRREFVANSIRVEVDDINISVQKRIDHNNEIKIPYVLVAKKDGLNRDQLYLCSEGKQIPVDVKELINKINDRLAAEGYVRDTE
jgi:threonyl-tRNA synthetase